MSTQVSKAQHISRLWSVERSFFCPGHTRDDVEAASLSCDYAEPREELYGITNKLSWGGSVADGTFTVLETALTLFPSAMTRVVPPCSAVLESALHAVVHASFPSAAVSPRDLCAAGVCASVCSLAAWA